MVEAGTTPVGYADSPRQRGHHKAFRHLERHCANLSPFRHPERHCASLPPFRHPESEVPIPGADGYAYGGQRDGQTDDVEDPVDRLQTRDAGLERGAPEPKPRASMAVASLVARRMESTSSPNAWERARAMALPSPRPRERWDKPSARQSSCSSVNMRNPANPPYTNRGEKCRISTRPSAKSVGSRPKAESRRYGNGRHPDSRGDGQIDGSLADHNPATLPQDLARGAAVRGTRR